MKNLLLGIAAFALMSGPAMAAGVTPGDIGRLNDVVANSWTFDNVTSVGDLAITDSITGEDITITRAPAADSATTNTGGDFNLTSPVDTTGTNIHNALNVDLTIGNASGGTNTVNGLNFANYTGDAQVNVNAIKIGTSDGLGTANALTIGAGWDAGIVTDSALKVNSTNGTALTAIRIGTDTDLDSGQTSEVVTVTGATSASLCFATITNDTTTEVSVTNVVAGTDQATVQVSADPSTSGADLAVICYN